MWLFSVVLSSIHVSLGWPHVTEVSGSRAHGVVVDKPPERQSQENSGDPRGKSLQRPGLPNKLFSFYVQALSPTSHNTLDSHSYLVRSLYDLGWDVTLAR